MGIVITKDLLKKIYSDYEKNKDKIPKKKPKKEKPKSIEIFRNNLVNVIQLDKVYKKENNLKFIN